EALERLGPDDAKPPRIRAVMIRCPARKLEQLVERLGRNWVAAERLVRPSRADQVRESLHATDTSDAPSSVPEPPNARSPVLRSASVNAETRIHQFRKC